jgi:hypothetical protein
MPVCVLSVNGRPNSPIREGANGALCPMKSANTPATTTAVGEKRTKAKCARNGVHRPPDVHPNDADQLEQVGRAIFSTKGRSCTLVSRRTLVVTDLVPARLDNVGALAH